MFRCKPVWQCLACFGLAFGLLIAPWPGWGERYARGLHRCGEAIFDPFGAKGVVRFQFTPEGTLHDTTIFLGNKDMVERGKMPAARVLLSTRYVAWLPTALVAALVLATPIPWRRRLWALAWALVLIHAFIGFILWLMILHQYNDTPALSLFLLKPFPEKILRALYQVLVTYTGAFFAVPVLIWLLVSFRREDWAKFLGKLDPPPNAESET